MIRLISLLVLAAVANSQVLQRSPDFKTARSVQQRDAAQVLADLQTANTDCKSLGTAVNNWSGTTSGAIPIANAFNKFEGDVNKTITDVGASSASTSAQAQQICNYLGNPLEPCVLSDVNALISKKAKFTSAGLQPTICSGLKRLLSEVQKLCSGVYTKTPSAQLSNCQGACNKIIADIQKAVTSFC